MASPLPAAPRPARPTIVTVASWLQLASVVVLLALVMLVVFAAVHHDRQVDEVIARVGNADPEEVTVDRQVNLFMASLSGVPTLLLAGWLAATALRVRRGSKTARTLVFVAAAAQMLLCPLLGCFGALLVRTQLTGSPAVHPSSSLAEHEQSDFSMMIDAQRPNLDLVFGMVSLGLLVAPFISAVVVLLLSRPSATQWFTRPPAPAQQP